MNFQTVSPKKHKTPVGIASIRGGSSRSAIVFASGESFSCFSWPIQRLGTGGES